MEVAALPAGQVAARDSKRGSTGPVLAFSGAEWRAFADGVRAGEFDLPH